MPKYTIVIGSPIDYEELVAYVYVENAEANASAKRWAEEKGIDKFDHIEVKSNGQLVAIVSKEEGPDKVKVELFGLLDDKKTNKVVDFDLLIEALYEAKTSLLE